MQPVTSLAHAIWRNGHLRCFFRALCWSASSLALASHRYEINVQRFTTALNPVLSVMQKHPFENVWEIPPVTLFSKVTFPVTITYLHRFSEPTALFSKSRLPGLPSFLLKVMSVFTLKCILSFSLPMTNATQGDYASQSECCLGCAGVPVNYRFFFFHKMDSLFLITEGPCKGWQPLQQHSWDGLGRPLFRPTQLDQVPPFSVTANSTRILSASWDLCRQASVSQVCKAATWLPVHTVTKLMLLHPPMLGLVSRIDRQQFSFFLFLLGSLGIFVLCFLYPGSPTPPCRKTFVKKNVGGKCYLSPGFLGT